MRRRPWIAPLVGVLLLLAAQVAYWRYLESQLDAGFAAWLAARRAAGWTVNAGAAEHGGWPLAATLSVPGMMLQGGEPDIPGGVAWRAERLVLSLDLLSPATLRARAEGAQRLRLADLPAVAFTADSAVALLPLQADTPPHAVSLTISNLRAGLPGSMDGSPPDGASLTAGLVQLDAGIKPAAPAGEAALTFRLGVEAINLPADRAWPLGRRLSSVSIEGAVDGPVPQARGLVPRAAAWRDGGGTLEVKHLTLGWGPLGLSGAATLALDARLQPMGTGTARLVGYAAALDALAAARVLPPSAATAAKAVLSLLARPIQDGGPPEVEVPLTLQDRILSMRQLPLARLPEVIWPAP